MKRKTYLIITVSCILILVIFRLANPDITKEVVSLDCKVTYQKSIFGREYEGFSDHNAKMDVAKCLCSKYSETKNIKYKMEIQKILSEFEYEKNVEEVCKDSETYFSYWYYE